MCSGGSGINAFDNNSALRPWEDKEEHAVQRTRERKEVEEETLKEKRSWERERKSRESVRELQ